MHQIWILWVAMVLAWPANAATAGAPAPAAAPAASILLLVRHGYHSTEPVDDPAQGPPLTSVGLDQARLTAKRLRESGLVIDEVLASPMLRSQQTGQAILGELKGARMTSLSDLTECTPPAPPEQSAALVSAVESKACADQFDRVYDAYFRPVGGAKVLVAHANVIRYLLTKALGMDIRNWQQFSISHASVSTVRIGPDGSVMVLGVGDIGHVPQNIRSGSVLDSESGGRRHR